MLLNGTNVPTVTFWLFVTGVSIVVADPELILPLAPAVNVSAFNVIVLLFVEIVFAPTASVPPAFVLKVAPPGPLTFPFNVMSPEFANVTEPEFALALKFVEPVLLKLMLPAPAATTALKVPAVVLIAVPAPILPLAVVRLTLPAPPTLMFPAAALLMSPPTFTVTVFPVAVMIALFVNVPLPVLWKLRFPVIVRLAPTVIFPTYVVLFPTCTVAAVMLLKGTNVPTVTFWLFVTGVNIVVAVPELILPLAPAVNVSAFNVIVLLFVEIVFAPIASVPPAFVLKVTPAGPLTFPFNVMSPAFDSATEPEFALALKLVEPVLLKLILPAPPVTVALSIPVVVLSAVPAPIVPLAVVRLTLPAPPTLMFPAAALLMSPPTFTVTVLPVAVMVALFVNVPPPVLWKLRFPVVVRLAPTVMFPTYVELFPTWTVAAVMLLNGTNVPTVTLIICYWRQYCGGRSGGDTAFCSSRERVRIQCNRIVVCRNCVCTNRQRSACIC